MIYETDEDRAREANFALAIEERFNCQLIKLGYEWEFDFLIARNKQLTGIAELKVRTHEVGKYETVIISEHKTRSAFSFAARTLCYDEKSKKFQPPRFIYFVKFTDKEMYTVVDEREFDGYMRQKLTARNHADDPTDAEYVRYIPIKKFKVF